MRQCRLPPTPLVWCSAVVTAYSRFALSSLCCGYLHCLLPDAGFCDCLQGRIVMFQQALEVFEQLLMRLGLRSSESPAHLGRRYGGDVGKRAGPEAWTSYAQPGQPRRMGGGKHGEVGLRSVGPGSGDVARGHLADPPGVPLLEEVWVRTCEV